MRVREARASDFGPLIDQTLRLPAGLAVVFGSNEAGKSSWHAALYSGLCGMRRGRGKPRAEDVAFELRHAPWSGKTWAVQLECELDDGREVQISQDLDGKGATMVDLLTGEDLAHEVLFEGAPDASRFFDLDRKVFARTAWVRQAEVMSVREEPAALQALMQTVVSSSEVTASDALRNIAEFRHEHVGIDRMNSVRPLRRSIEKVSRARSALDVAIGRQQEVRTLDASLAAFDKRILVLERAYDRLGKAAKAFELCELTERFDYLQSLHDQFPDAVAPSSHTDDHARYLRVREVLGQWEALVEVEQPPTVSAEVLEMRLRDLSRERDAETERTAHLSAGMAILDEARLPPNAQSDQLLGHRILWAVCIFGGLIAAALALRWPPAWGAVAALSTGALLLGYRGHSQPDAAPMLDTRSRLEKLMDGQGLSPGSLETRFSEYLQQTMARQCEREATVVLIESQRAQILRDEAHRSQQQARHYEARDALSAAVSSIGASPQDEAVQDVALLSSWCENYLDEQEASEATMEQWRRLRVEQERTPIADLQKALQELESSLDGYDGEIRAVGRDELLLAEREISQAREARAQLSGRLSAASQHLSVSDAEVAFSEAQRELAQVQRLDQTLTSTAEILAQAEEAAYRAVAPRIQERLGALVAEATQDRYVRLTVSPEDLLIRVETAPGEWRDAQQLSHGTAELIYLLLRIVLTEQLCSSTESAPLFLDDVTVHFDEARTVDFLELVRKLSVDRQIVLFTQEVAVQTWARTSLASHQLLSVG